MPGRSLAHNSCSDDAEVWMAHLEENGACLFVSRASRVPVPGGLGPAAAGGSAGHTGT